MQGHLTPHPWRCFEQPLQLRDEAAVRRIPRTNVNCTESLRTSEPDALARQLDAERVVEIDTGHDLMITEAGAVATLLLDLAAP
jgi:hypothetical protein